MKDNSDITYNSATDKQIDDTRKHVIIFICHNDESIEKVIDKIQIDNVFIILVGNNQINEKYTSNNKILIARNYPYNIEDEKELLTFTAWYCISKNNLFPDQDFLSLLEYDVILKEDFLTNLNYLCMKNDLDIISFLFSPECWEWVTKKNILEIFLQNKSCRLPENKYCCWMPTTNHCIRRNIINEFVDWYYPDCHFLKKEDSAFYSYYHERLFSLYVIQNNKRITILPGLEHLFLTSHSHFTGGTEGS
jgi:hypothetical protein